MTAPIDQSALGRWHALQAAIDVIAPLTNAARDAVANAPPDLAEFARSKAATLEGLRDRLVASIRLGAQDMPQQPQEPPSTARKSQGARQ